MTTLRMSLDYAKVCPSAKKLFVDSDSTRSWDSGAQGSGLGTQDSELTDSEFTDSEASTPKVTSCHSHKLGPFRKPETCSSPNIHAGISHLRGTGKSAAVTIGRAPQFLASQIRN